ncbi:hypothetical protein PI125_g11357 [Phytophthora idaei]|nr:hypothetical protein PI125_g11357 [Phytophthora idaei]
MTSLSLKDATELVAKYAARASSESADFTVSSPCRLCRSGFGAAVGRSWPLSPTDCWVRLDIATLSQPNVPLPQTGKLSLSQQLQTRRALLELICQLSATPSCRWPESVESLWWPAVLRPTDFKDEKYLETVHDIGPKPRFALSTGRPTLESVQMLYQFLQMDHKELLLEEDWQLLKSLRVSVSKRERQRVEICFRLANNVVDTSILRSMADGLREYLDVKAWREEKDEYPRIEFQITELWFHNCRFLNGSEDVKLLAQIVTLPSSTIRSLMLPGVFFNSLRNPLQVLLLHSNAKCLKSLQLETINSGADSNNSEKIIWTQMERALLANSSLRCLHLSLPSADSYEAATSLIKPFHGQILRYHTPMRLKTAFLSVVEHVTSPLFMRALDHMVLSNVFSFAATSAIRRQVNVRR